MCQRVIDKCLGVFLPSKLTFFLLFFMMMLKVLVVCVSLVSLVVGQECAPSVSPFVCVFVCVCVFVWVGKDWECSGRVSLLVLRVWLGLLEVCLCVLTVLMNV